MHSLSFTKQEQGGTIFNDQDPHHQVFCMMECSTSNPPLSPRLIVQQAEQGAPDSEVSVELDLRDEVETRQEKQAQLGDTS